MSFRRSTLSVSWVFAALAIVACSNTDANREVEQDATSVVKAPLGGSAAAKPDENLKYVPGEIIVRFKPDAGVGAVADALMERGQAFSTVSKVGRIDQLNAKFGAVRMKSRGEIQKHRRAAIPAGTITSGVVASAVNASTQSARTPSERDQGSNPLYRVQFADPKVDVVHIAAQYAKDPSVEYAGPNRLYFTEAVPPDTMHPDQWSHRQTEAAAGWDVQTGSPNTVVAVVDTGVDYHHEDLQTQIWHDQNGNPGRDFVDIDMAGYLAAGYKADPLEDYTVDDDDPSDVQGHGTHCAGIVAAAHNGIGVAGVAPGVRIMPVRAGFKLINGQNKSIGLFTEDNIADAIRYATDHGASVISMSIGGLPSPLIKQAVEYAAAHGVVLVAAAGNSAQSGVSYPAGYPEVIAVAATGPTNTKSSYSNFGSWITVAAPGGEVGSAGGVDCIISTFPGTYGYACGTSMAAPYVAGLAALLRSADPSASASELRGRLIGTADPVAGDYRWDVGGGRVNVRRALTEPRAANLRVAGYALSEFTGNGDGVADAGETARLTLRFENAWARTSNAIAFLASTPQFKVRNPQWNIGPVSEFATFDNASAPFEIELSPSVLPGQEVSLELTIVANDTVQAIYPLRFNVGMKVLQGNGTGAASIDMSGDNVATVRFDEESLSFNVYVLDVASGQERKLTDMTSAGDFMDMFSGPVSVAISGPIVVWQDERNGMGQPNIYSYDLRTGISGPLVAESGTQANPDVYGNVVVWADTRIDAEGDIHMYDLTTKRETPLARPGRQTLPRISGNTIVWQNQSAGVTTLRAYDIATQGEWTVATIQSDARLNGLHVSKNTVAYTTELPGNPATFEYWTVNVDGTNPQSILTSTDMAHFDLYNSTVVFNTNGLTLYDARTGTYENPIVKGATQSAYFPVIAGPNIVWEQVTPLKERVLALTHHGHKVGDANADGVLTAADATDIANYSVGFPVPRFDTVSADVNCDGQVGIVDAMLVQRKVEGKVDYLPCELE